MLFGLAAANHECCSQACLEKKQRVTWNRKNIRIKWNWLNIPQQWGIATKNARQTCSCLWKGQNSTPSKQDRQPERNPNEILGSCTRVYTEPPSYVNRTEKTSCSSLNDCRHFPADHWNNKPGKEKSYLLLRELGTDYREASKKVKKNKKRWSHRKPLISWKGFDQH